MVESEKEHRPVAWIQDQLSDQTHATRHAPRTTFNNQQVAHTAEESHDQANEQAKSRRMTRGICPGQRPQRNEEN